jgi:uncharacterized protein
MMALGAGKWKPLGVSLYWAGCAQCRNDTRPEEGGKDLAREEGRDKAKANRAKHGLSFETAVLVFDDALHVSRPDPHPDGDRWHTIGLEGSILLLVVHTWPDESEEGEQVGRIISARNATAHERKAYEEGSI